MRAVMAKLRRNRGGDFSRLNRRRPTRSSMSKDEAAVAIQKSETSNLFIDFIRALMIVNRVVWRVTKGYRGYSVRKEYGCAPNKAKRFQCCTIEEEAANTIQYFWRKWKGKSLFQQLLLYRADKQHQLTYFCQQVSTFQPIRFASNVWGGSPPKKIKKYCV